MRILSDNELLTINPLLLTEHERQKRFLLQQAQMPCACPACGKLSNKFDAAKAAKASGKEGGYECPGCHVELDDIVPVMMPLSDRKWLWVIPNTKA